MEFSAFVQGLAAVGVAGFVGWVIASVIAIRKEMAAMQLKMAESYAPNTAIFELKHQIEKVDDKVDSMLRLLYEIAARSHINTD